MNSIQQENGTRINLADAGPHPLGETVQQEQARHGGNAFVIAKQLAARECKEDQLPPAVREARSALEKIEAEKGRADAKLTAEMIEWQGYQNHKAAIAVQNAVIAEIESLLARAKADLAGFDNDFSFGVVQLQSDGQRAMAGLCARLDSFTRAKIFVEHLPACIESERTKLKSMQAAAAAVQSKYDFA